jgi:murein DD-endopeptidase MepM/ murein hydrolase activator NlpD
MPKILAITDAMHSYAKNILAKAGDIQSSHNEMGRITNGMTPYFSGMLPELLTQRLLDMKKKHEALYEKISQYSEKIDYAADNYDWSDREIAGWATRLGLDFTPRRPVQGGTFTSRHGVDNHHGIDLSLEEGSQIVAAVGGTIITNSNDGSWNDGYGNFVKILGDDGNTYYYAHMSNTANNSVGSRVEAGDLIGYVGSTGYSTGNHLHFEIRDPNGGQLNPEEVHPDMW